MEHERGGFKVNRSKHAAPPRGLIAKTLASYDFLHKPGA
jgi:hypothetical protein